MKLTATVLSEMLNHLIVERRAELGLLCKQIKEMKALVADDDDHTVSSKLSIDFPKAFVMFYELNKDIQGHLCEEEVQKG